MEQSTIAVFRERLKEARRQSGISLEDLAAASGVSRQAYQAWESGKTNPEMSRIPLIAEATGKPVAWFFPPSTPAEAELIIASLHDLAKQDRRFQAVLDRTQGWSPDQPLSPDLRELPAHVGALERLERRLEDVVGRLEAAAPQQEIKLQMLTGGRADESRELRRQMPPAPITKVARSVKPLKKRDK